MTLKDACGKLDRDALQEELREALLKVQDIVDALAEVTVRDESVEYAVRNMSTAEDLMARVMLGV